MIFPIRHRSGLEPTIKHITDTRKLVAFRSHERQIIDERPVQIQFVFNIMRKRMKIELRDHTILYNITMGQSEANAGRVATVIHDLKLADTLFNNPEGLNAPILTGNFRLSESAKYKLTLARAIVAQPKLVVIDDSILTLEKSEKLQILGYLMDKSHGWSLICISNDPHIAALCDRQIYLEEGKIINRPIS